MVSGDEAYHGSSGRIRGAGGRDRRGGGKIVGGVSSRIRSGTRSRRRILGPCDGPPHADVSTLAASFMSPTRRIKALGWILLRCDLNWNCKSTTAMSQTRRSEPPPWSCRRRLRQIGPLRRSLLRVVHWGSNKWPLEKGEDDQTVESVNKVTASLEMSISDMETDDENGALADPAAVEDDVAPVPLAEPEAMEAMAPAPQEQQNATELVPQEFILSMLEVFRSDQMDEH